MDEQMAKELEFLTEEGEKAVYNRGFARDVVFKFVFEYEVLGEEVLQRLEWIKQTPFQKRDKDYITSSVQGIVQHIKEIDETIEQYSENWNIRRLSKVAMAAIRVGVYEMKYADDIPPRVSLNECINLAKKYDVPASGKFVNGILANLYQETEEPKSEEAE